MFKKKLTVILIGLFSVFILVAMYLLSSYIATPDHLRKPAYEHYHFRTQIIVNGKAVNFGESKFQTAYDSTACSAEVGGHPVDFHDDADQMTHVHWKGVTGGDFLKYYGWNLVGGDSESLGYRYDEGFFKRHKIRIFGHVLPQLPKTANFYIYTGDGEKYEKKEWRTFLKQDLEVFFGKKSNLNQPSALLNWLLPKAYAHGEVVDEHDEEELSRINNLIGNVVIFVQEEEPSAKEIKDKFNNLAPLKDSSCGG